MLNEYFNNRGSRIYDMFNFIDYSDIDAPFKSILKPGLSIFFNEATYNEKKPQWDPKSNHVFGKLISLKTDLYSLSKKISVNE